MTKTVSGTTTIEAQYAYDPYGIATKLQGSQEADFQYAGYYMHAPSGLNLTRTRQYSASLGRWLSRDPIAEAGGVNLYTYVGNNAVSFIDPSGTQYAMTWGPASGFLGSLGWAAGAAGGVVGLPVGIYDIGTRGIPEIRNSVGVLTGEQGWFGPNGLGGLFNGSSCMMNQGTPPAGPYSPITPGIPGPAGPVQNPWKPIPSDYTPWGNSYIEPGLPEYGPNSPYNNPTHPEAQGGNLPGEINVGGPLKPFEQN